MSSTTKILREVRPIVAGDYPRGHESILKNTMRRDVRLRERSIEEHAWWEAYFECEEVVIDCTAEMFHCPDVGTETVTVKVHHEESGKTIRCTARPITRVYVEGKHIVTFVLEAEVQPC